MTPVVALADVAFTSAVEIAAWTSAAELRIAAILHSRRFAAEHVVPAGEVIEHHFFFVELFGKRVGRSRTSTVDAAVDTACSVDRSEIFAMTSSSTSSSSVRSVSSDSSSSRSLDDQQIARACDSEIGSSARLPNSTTCNGADGAVVGAGVSHGVGSC